MEKVPKLQRKKNFFTRLLDNIRKHYTLYLLTLVPLIFLILFSYMPIYGVQIAFRDYKVTKGILESPWVGLKYFNKLFNYYNFPGILKNTLTLSLYSLLTFPCALLLALMLNYMPSQRYKKTIQLVSYAPHFLSTVVMCGMVLQFLDARTGLINALLSVFGVEAQNYMANPNAFAHVYVWSGVWQGVGYSSIIYIAALSAVSPELHEAAIVDGANILQRIWHVDIPSVLPTFCILLIMRCGSIMGSDFEKILLLQNNLNLNVSEVISTYTYRIGLMNIPQYSYSTAIGLFTSVINVALLVFVNGLSRKLTDNGLW